MEDCVPFKRRGTNKMPTSSGIAVLIFMSIAAYVCTIIWMDGKFNQIDRKLDKIETILKVMMVIERDKNLCN